MPDAFKKPYRARWGREKELQLAALVKQGVSPKELALIFGRRLSTIQLKLERSGFIYLNEEELKEYGVSANEKMGKKIGMNDCPEKSQRMRKLYPN